MTCLRCGYCCKVAPCQYGRWDPYRHQCVFLTQMVNGDYSCDRYEEILGSPGSEISPAFGAGCCSTFNSDRMKKTKPWEKRKEIEEDVR